MTPLHHGITVRDAAILATQELGHPVTEGTVRVWLTRGRLVRTGDRQICPFSLRDWLSLRDPEQARRRARQASA